MLMQSGRIYGAMSIRATQKLLSSSIPSNCCASERSSERTNRHEWDKHARMCWEMKSLWIIDNFSTWMVIISIAMVFSSLSLSPSAKWKVRKCLPHFYSHSLPFQFMILFLLVLFSLFSLFLVVIADDVNECVWVLNETDTLPSNI